MQKEPILKSNLKSKTTKKDKETGKLDEKTDVKPVEDKASKYLKEFSSWRNDLKQYWAQIDKNQEMYEFYQNENDQDSNASLNTPFAIIESMVSKASQAKMKVTTKAEGTNDLNDLESWISSVVKRIITDKDIAQIKGDYSKIKEKFFREFLVKGNAIATIDYLYLTQIVSGGEKQVIADNPYLRVRNYKDIIFNPAKTLADSDVYYIQSYLKLSDLKKHEEKDGNGLYKNLDKVKVQAEDNNKQIDEQYISGEKKITKKVEPLRIIERWEGTKYIVIADTGNDTGVIIREAVDPLKIGRHNLFFGMNYVINDRPYAYGEIDAIYKPVKAQDKILQQSLDIVDRYLRPNILVRDTNVDLNQLLILVNEGGAMYGDPETIGNVPSQLPPQQAFQTIELMQQGIERAARFSPYSAGVQTSSTDKTKGTMGGIQALQNAAEPNFEIKLEALQKSLDEPYAMTALKMVANLMGETDVRYGLLEDKKPMWVKATKAILQGKFTFRDAVNVGLMSEEAMLEYTTTVDHNTGDIIPIKGADEAIIIDVDWLISVKLDNQSATDKQIQVERKMSIIDKGTAMGVQFNPERTIAKLAQESGFEDIEDLFMTDEEKQEKMQEIMQQQQMQQIQQAKQVEQESQQADKEAERSQMIKQNDIKAKLAMHAMKTKADLIKANMQNQNKLNR